MVTGANLFLGLFNNLAFFILLVAIYGFFVKYLENISGIRRHLLLGVGFGICAVACMYVKIPVFKGVIVDQRNTVVTLCGVFGGPIAAFVCAAIAAVYRIVLGGDGAVGGVIGVHLAALAGTILFFFKHRIDSIPKAMLATMLAVILILPGFMFIGDWHEGWQLTKAMAIPYGSAIFIGIFLVGLLIENEERRYRATSALVKSEEQFRSIYERLIDVIYRTDAGGRLSAVSPSIEKLTGYSVEEAVGKNIGSFLLNPKHGALFLRELEENGHVSNFEAEFVTKYGYRRWLSSNATVLTDEAGKVLGIEGVARDISKQKTAEVEKVKLEEALNQSQKMEAMGTLAGGIAHDFNNILGAVIGYAELLKDELPKGDIEEEYIGNILKASERARELVQQILMFSRKGEQVFKPVELNVVVEETVKLLRKTIPATVTIVADIHPETAIVIGNATQIQQVVFNLCTNAFHALSDEKGEICIRLTPEQLIKQERASLMPRPAHGRFVVLTVKDNGTGIEPEKLQRIFEPFFTTKQVGKGTGMGLSVVHGIVQTHGGKIEVDSTPGEGSEFRVYWPLSEASCEEFSDMAAPIGGHERILLVDDEQMLLDSTRMILEKSGYRVEGKLSAKEAFEMFRDAPDSFDLVITDQTMSEMPGHTLLREIKSIADEIPIVIVTGHSSLLDREKAEALGAAAFLMKPLKQDELIRTVREVLDAAM